MSLTRMSEALAEKKRHQIAQLRAARDRVKSLEVLKNHAAWQAFKDSLLNLSRAKAAQVGMFLDAQEDLAQNRDNAARARAEQRAYDFAVSIVESPDAHLRDIEQQIETLERSIKAAEAGELV